MKVNTVNLGKEVGRILKNYGDDINIKAKQETLKVADEAKNTAKNKSPTGSRGKYKRGWYVSVRNETATSIDVAVHNTEYRLPHLLEFGHALRNGGRSKAIPHVKPAEEEAIGKLEKGIRDSI